MDAELERPEIARRANDVCTVRKESERGGRERSEEREGERRVERGSGKERERARERLKVSSLG